MAPNEKSELVDALEASRREFIAAADAIGESRAGAKPDPARWSALECIEHVTFVEDRFRGFLEKSERGEAKQDKQKESDLQKQVVNRENRFQAPEAVQPIGRYSTL